MTEYNGQRMRMTAGHCFWLGMWGALGAFTTGLILWMTLMVLTRFGVLDEIAGALTTLSWWPR